MTTIQYLQVEIGRLKPNPYNSNRVTAENELKIRESIRRNGLFKPIIVRSLDNSSYEIVGGQHRWEQAKELGFTEIPIVDLGKISDKRAKEIGLLDNARYGADDTLSLSEILKDIGGAEEIQSFLPYGDTDLSALFSATAINLDDLTLPEETTAAAAPEPELEAPAPKLAKTHTLMRFKISLGDAERLTALIARTQKDQGFTGADDLTNAGDALIHLISTAGLLSAAAKTPADWDDMLDEIEAAQKDDDE